MGKLRFLGLLGTVGNGFVVSRRGLLHVSDPQDRHRRLSSSCSRQPRSCPAVTTRTAPSRPSATEQAALATAPPRARPGHARRCAPRSTGSSPPAGRSAGSTPRSTPAAWPTGLVRCADFEGQRYCLHTGWTDRTEADVQARVSTAARTIAPRRGDPPRRPATSTCWPRSHRAAALDPQERAAAERRELTQAARSVAKVWLLRHEIEGVALPDDFLADTPRPGPAHRGRHAAKPKTLGDYPERAPSCAGPEGRPSRAAPTGAARPPCR